MITNPCLHHFQCSRTCDPPLRCMECLKSKRKGDAAFGPVILFEDTIKYDRSIGSHWKFMLIKICMIFIGSKLILINAGVDNKFYQMVLQYTKIGTTYSKHRNCPKLHLQPFPNRNLSARKGIEISTFQFCTEVAPSTVRHWPAQEPSS